MSVLSSKLFSAYLPGFIICYLAPSLYIQIHDCSARLDPEAFTGKYVPVGTSGDRILYKHTFLDDQIGSLSLESQSVTQKYFVYYGDDEFVFEANDNINGLDDFNEDALSKFEIHRMNRIIFIK